MSESVLYRNNFIDIFITILNYMPKSILFLNHCLCSTHSPPLCPALTVCLYVCLFVCLSACLAHLWPGAQARVKMAQNKQMFSDNRSEITFRMDTAQWGSKKLKRFVSDTLKEFHRLRFAVKYSANTWNGNEFSTPTIAHIRHFFVCCSLTLVTLPWL